MKKRFFRIIVLVIIASAVAFSVRWYWENEKETGNGQLKIYGTIDIRDASLAFIEQERIAEVLVEEGDQVKAGQVLARLDTDRLKAQIVEAQAQIAARGSSQKAQDRHSLPGDRAGQGRGGGGPGYGA